MVIKCVVFCLTGLVVMMSYATGFDVNVVTNKIYDSNCGRVRSCVVHQDAAHTTISNVVLTASAITLIKNLSDVYLRRIALREFLKPKLNVDQANRVYMIGHDMNSFPEPLPDQFSIFGLKHHLLEVTILPYVVENIHIKGRLTGGLCIYRMKGRFQFALYVNLNTYEVNPDFYSGSGCKMIVSSLGRYPFLSEYIAEQEKFVNYINNFSGVGRHGKCEGKNIGGVYPE